jgi:hypothetical protein
MKRWTDTLPPTMADRKPERRAETAMRYSVEAMAALRQGDQKTALLMIRVAAAEVRAWRMSLVDQDLRFSNGKRKYLDDRELLRITIRSITLADMHGPRTGIHLRAAEAALRLLGKRLRTKGQQ